MIIHKTRDTRLITVWLILILVLTTGCQPVAVVPAVSIKNSVTPKPTQTRAISLTPDATLTAPFLTLSPTPFFPTPSINVNQLIEQPLWGKGAISGGDYSPDGKRLGVFTTQGVYIYDSENFNQLDRIPSPSAYLVAAFSPDWSLLATASDSTITILRLAGKAVVTHLETDQGKVTRVLFSPDGHYLASLVMPPGGEVYSPFLDLWEVSDWKRVGTWNAGGLPAVAFAPDSKSIYAWNAFRMDGVYRWQIPSGSPISITKNWYPITLASSPDGKWMAWGEMWADNPGIIVQRTSDGSQALKLAWEQPGFSGSLLFTPDSSRLAAVSDDGLVKVWEIADGSLVSTFNSESARSPLQAISPDGQSLLLSGVDGLVLYRLADGYVLRRQDSHPGTIVQAALSPKEDQVAVLFYTGDQNKTSLAIWSYPAGEVLYSIKQVEALRFSWSPTGDRLALADWDGKISILRSIDGKLVQTLPGHAGQVQSVAWSSDGTQIASSSFSVKVWQVSDGTLLSDLGGSGQWISSLHFSPDGKLLVGSDADGKIDIWTISDRKLIVELPVTVFSDSDVIAFEPNGSYVGLAETTKLTLWKWNEEKPFLQLQVINVGVTTLCISPDGSMAVGGLTDGGIYIWQISDGKLLRTLKGGNDGISSLGFTKDGKTLIAASRDGTLHFWEIQK